MLTLILAQAANENGGNVVGGLLLFLGIAWFIAYLCRPGRKGYDIRHKGQTTVTPR